MNSLIALFTAFILWLNPAASDSRFTKYKISSSSGTFTTTSTSFTDVTNLSLSFKSTGRPVMLGVQSTGGVGTGAGPYKVSRDNFSSGYFGFAVRVLRDGATVVCNSEIGLNLGGFGGTEDWTPFGSLPSACLDPVTAGTYAYKVQAMVNNSSNTGTIESAKLYVYELP